MSTKNEHNNIEWRRDKVQEYLSQGHTQREISIGLQISLGTVNSDAQYLRDRARENIHNYVHTTLPEEMERTLTGLNKLIKQRYQDLDDPNATIRDKQNATQIIKDCYTTRLEIMGAGVLASDINKGSKQEYDEAKAVSRTV